MAVFFFTNTPGNLTGRFIKQLAKICPSPLQKKKILSPNTNIDILINHTRIADKYFRILGSTGKNICSQTEFII